MPENQNGGDIDFSLLPPPTSGLPKEENLRHRLELLRDQFCTKFKAEPTLYLRVPGRVNLIGEHVDYCGYSVCPMALQQDILVAFRPTELHTFLTIINQDIDNYVEYSTDSRNFKFSLQSTGWASYVLCGVRAIMELLSSKVQAPVSMQMAIAGNIPPGSGLSSSSALVCAGVLATALANKLELSKTELATFSANAELHIGTAGGGMDQAIIFLASPGCAKLIEFNPLRTTEVSLPPGAVFVVANSLIAKNKAASNDFNIRVVECRLAAQVLAKNRNILWQKCLRLADFQIAAGLEFDEVTKLVIEVLHEAPYSKAELCKILEVSEEELNILTFTKNTHHVEEFKLFQRAMHVFQEAERVAQFIACCGGDGALARLGQLMSQSHSSLRDLYQCSHPQLDRLVSVATAAGALGARLTGAGWGGCMVALTTEDNVDKFIATVKEQFYAKIPEAAGQNINNLIFATQPGQGVQIFSPDADFITN
uniref:Galactokinase n=1 Tax=Graphocephala atropunctata TaxID=36148 RepID=A0A1B6MNJ6_9HEMI